MKGSLKAVITNKELLALAKSDATYKSWTSKLSDQIFTEAGFEEINLTGSSILSDFFGLSVRVVLQKIMKPNPRIPDLYKLIVEEYSNVEGGIFQRINTKLLKPTSPKYRGLVNGGSVDPFMVRKPETNERFYKQNFDYQNFVTIQDIDLKKMFVKEYGINEYVASILESLDKAYVIQKYEIMRDMISKAINSVVNPLKDTQKIEMLEITDSSTNAQMASYLEKFHNLYSLMLDTVKSGEFNAKGYEKGLYPENYVLLMRADIWNHIKTTLMATTYHNELLNMPFQLQLVKDFGGLTYETTGGVALLPVYDDFGAVMGFNASGSKDDPLIDPKYIVTVDPNPNVDALLIEKGAIFTSEQNPYTTKTIYNPAGLYTNFWASQPNSSFNYDACYDIIEFYHTST